MTPRKTIFTAVIGLFFIMATLHAAAVSRQQADAFARKVDLIVMRSEASRAPATRTPVTETELNSWFTYRAQPLLPAGVTNPQLTIVGNGKVMGTVTVDLQQVAKKHASNSSLDPLALLGGRVPVSIAGVLRTKDGRGQFDLQEADISGVPVPKAFLQEMLSYYSRTPDHPEGVRLDAPFALPANIREIEVDQGQAVVVQ
jgi:hypothetical protein